MNPQDIPRTPSQRFYGVAYGIYKNLVGQAPWGKDFHDKPEELRAELLDELRTLSPLWSATSFPYMLADSETKTCLEIIDEAVSLYGKWLADGKPKVNFS